MTKSKPASEDLVARLCPACGLCCNGVLFADVKLQAGDNPERLVHLGVPLQKTGRSITFSQPCSCFNGSLCRIYPERPLRCRAFACGSLLRVQSGELSETAALRLIGRVKKQVRAVRQQLARLGNTEEHLPLNRRCANVMADPIDLAGAPDLVKARAELMPAVDRLMKLLQKYFLTLP